MVVLQGLKQHQAFLAKGDDIEHSPVVKTVLLVNPTCGTNWDWHHDCGGV